MRLKIAQVIGLNTDQKAAQVVSVTRENNTFFAVLQISSDDAFTKGRQILSGLEDFYFESDGSVPDKLKATFTEAEEKLLAGIDFDLSLAIISGKVLYIIGKGQVEVYLKRANKLSPLLSVGSASQLISGFLQDGDRVLFSSSSLIAFLGPDLEKSLSLPIDTFEEEVGSKIGTSDSEKQGLAGLAVEVLEENLEIAPLPQNLAADQTVSQGTVVSPHKSFESILRRVLNLLGRGKDYFPRSGKGRLIVAVVLILIIVAGAGYKYKSSRDAKTQAELNKFLQEAKDNLNAAKGLSSLNPADAKNKFNLSKEALDKALVLMPKNLEAGNFKKQLEAEGPSILQEARVADFPVFLDLDLVKENFQATQMSLSKGKLLLLDPAVKTLVLIDLAKKSNQILAGSEKLGEAASFSLNGGLAFIYSKDKGILKIDTTNSKLSTIAKKDSEWGEIKDIYGFAGNIYVADSGKNVVWKYLPSADGYSDKREYFSKDTKADLSNVLRIQIESSVYILKSGGEVLRFTKGDKDSFSFSGLPSNIKDPKSIFVSSDTDNLYVLDSGNSRLLILTKTGSYKGQLTGGKFSTATDVAVDEVEKKVYLLEGSKIYSVDLK